MTDFDGSEAELADLPEPSNFALGRIDTSRLLSPFVVRAFAGIVVAALVLVWPQRTDQILARLIGVGLVVASATAFWGAVRHAPRRIATAATAIVSGGVGLVLVLMSGRSSAFLGRLLGALLLVVVIRDLAQVWRTDAESATRTWATTRSVALAALGGVLIAFPAEVLAAATAVAAIVWIAFSIVVIAATLDADTEDPSGYAGAGEMVVDWLVRRPKSMEDRQALYDKVLYDAPRTRQRVARFVTLMTFASVIAAMGVITDSTAIVIGAMLIAPLMTPLMAMAMSLVMGWPHRLTLSASIALGGILLAIAIGLLLGWVAPTVIDTTTNSQILARATPTVLDLIVAVAAGAAGAYGLSRPDVSDALPGVAIAISLVPPLSVVGIAYSQGDWGAGNGALLLFTTNLVAILIFGGITFVVTGVTPIQRLTANQYRVRTSVAAVAMLAAVVFGALLLNGAEIAADAFDQAAVEDTVDDWLDEFPDHGLARIDRDGSEVTVVVVGPSDGAPDAQSLADALTADQGRAVTATVRLLVEERDVATGG
ncbi:DUF389 domain-containing protein [Ilumatobacter sp.]|uniref:DUF389 domain-containing protein n=1 Tax=Ilumatobacter sp. TaxID=1967498 RepID=UPI003AF81ED6